MYIYWMEKDFKLCPLTKEKCAGPACLAGWRWTEKWNGKTIKDMPRDGVDTKILPHMIGYCGMGGKPTDDELEPWNKSRSPGHFMPYNP